MTAQIDGRKQRKDNQEARTCSSYRNLGLSYKSWSGSFFPSQLPNRLHLDYYSQHFSTTELNGVFYRTPTAKAVRAWAEQTPPQFVFAWKASKFITHWKRLGPKSGNSLSLLESRLRLLKAKAGPVLFQLPPQFQKDTTRLASFLKRLRKPRPPQLVHAGNLRSSA